MLFDDIRDFVAFAMPIVVGMVAMVMFRFIEITIAEVAIVVMAFMSFVVVAILGDMKVVASAIVVLLVVPR